MKSVFAVICLLLVQNTFGQKIFGTVYTEQGDLLPYASVLIKGSSIGTSANNKGKFSMQLRPGKYKLVCQHIGYEAQEKEVELTLDAEITFVMKEIKLSMSEVVVKSGGEDPAYAIIREAIKKRNYYHKQVDAFTAERYSKDIIKLRDLPKRILGQKIKEEDVKEMGLDSTGKGIVYLSESMGKIYADPPDKFKMEILSSRVSGSDGFGLSFPVFISLYTNNVKLFTERFNPRGFVSPIADGAIGFYRFKFLGTFFEDGVAINSIQVTPRRKYEPLFTGTINITDGDWRIHSFDLAVDKTAQLEMLNTLSIRQLHVPISKDIWRTKNQWMNFNAKLLGIDLEGNFINVYSNYDLEPQFDKTVFNNVVIKYDTAVSSREKEWWDTVRPVPLEVEEQLDYKFKDSLFTARKDSFLTTQDIDSLKKRQGKIKPQRLILSGIQRTHYSKTNRFNWGVEPLLTNMEYNTAEGVVLQVIPYFEKRYSGALVVVEPFIRYGFYNGHLNPSINIEVSKRQRSPNEKYLNVNWYFSGGKRVSQFNSANPIPPLINTVSTLLYGNNFMKTYENYYGSANYYRKTEIGLSYSVGVLYEDRIPLENSTIFTVFKKDSGKFTPNYPYEKIDRQFDPHQAIILNLEINYQPGQKYIQFPRSKVSVGSKYPTFTFKYAKGLYDVLGSDVNFDKWSIDVSDDKNLKLAGLVRYKFGVGGFLNNKRVFIQDYQHFNGNQTRTMTNFVNTFQMAQYYANSTTENLYGIAHLEYHLNGLLTNKIPLFRRLNWHLVTGGNAFYVNRNSNYSEVFVGLENIFKMLRIDFIAAYENGIGGMTAVKFGAGGLFGARMEQRKATRVRSSSMVISF